MKEYWSTRIRDMVPYTPGEQPKGRTFIKLNTNENPYPPSPKVLEAIQAAAGDLRLYPDPESTALRDALAELYGLKRGQVFVGNGSDEVLALAFQAFFDPGRTILFPDVTYSFYPVFAKLYGLSFREVPLNERFGVPVDEFLGENGGVILPNPNAPTGRALPLEDVRRLAEGNPGAVVLIDEAYVDFGADSAVGLVERHPNLLVVQTCSKSRSLAGLRVGFALGHENLIAALECVKNSFNSYPLDRLAQAGALAAIQDRAYFQETTQKIIATRERFTGQLREMGFQLGDSAANFLFITHPKVPAKALLDGLRERGILVRWWDKPRISNHLRVTVGTDGEMEALCRALEECLSAELMAAF